MSDVRRETDEMQGDPLYKPFKEPEGFSARRQQSLTRSGEDSYYQICSEYYCVTTDNKYTGGSPRQSASTSRLVQDSEPQLVPKGIAISVFVYV